ncbi:MAG: VWA domain-containing protein [Bacteroidetes bacterium]|nr:VWA domain-containing protein [Bacteroidota bacterium]
MLRITLISIFIYFLTAPVVFAQNKEAYKQPRILILLDGSSSMVNEWSNAQTRFQAAGNIVLRLMDSVYKLNNQVEFSLRVYGHQHGVPENNCYDTKQEISFSHDNYTQMSLRLANLRPMGVSPIAYSLREAAENDFTNDRDYAYSLILVTDGGESCGGNICDVVKTLLDKKIAFKPYIVSLVDYAPLKEQYSCLGQYLTAIKPEDIEKAVGVISEGYRKVFAVPIIKSTLPVTPIPQPAKIKTVATPAIQMPKREPTKEAPPKEIKVAAIPQTEPKPVAESKPEPSSESSKIKVETALPQDHFSNLRRFGFERINYSLFWSTVTPKRKIVPELTLPSKETEPAAPQQTTAQPPEPKSVNKLPAKSEIKRAIPANQTIQAATTSITLEPAPETSLEVYFTDGKGKFYNSTPPMRLLDVKTGSEIKKFYRTIDGNGNPDPQTVPPGKYILSIGKTGNYKTKEITIQAANKNKVTVVVTKGTLIFRYDDNPQRPVKEFIASVRKTFEARSNIYQPCTEQREYEPANYHIEINTLPMMVRNIDLDFGWSYTIDIPEPGFVKFTNTNALGKVSLWAPLGDQFAQFYFTEINGNPNAQTIRLQPGLYEAHWRGNQPRGMQNGDNIVKFSVKSNATTEVEIK